MTDAAPRYKQPVSALVVIYAADTGRFLMLQRRDDPQFWQSVTGSLEPGETPERAARREVCEETGINIGREGLTLVDRQRCVRFELFAQWRHRYAPGTRYNTEHWFSLALPAEREIQLQEHLAWRWLDRAAAAALTKSWNNREAILTQPT